MSDSIRPFLSTAKTMLVRKPMDELARMRRWGPRAYFRIEAWKRQMEEAAYRLPALQPKDAALPPLEVWFLTGRRFWYQTAFCVWSLAHHSQRRLTLHLADDGTLTPELEQALRRLFPDGTTHWRQACQEKLEQLLPASKYPTLHQRWHDYINLHKLTTPHLGASGVQLVLDSDMLFFRRPEELLDWWDQPQGPCLMTDCEESYGYSRQLMEELAGAPIPSLLNVGICGLNSEIIDWEEVEYWCTKLVKSEGTSYYLEQALVAMLAARCTPAVMNCTSYITYPSLQQILASQGILHHYVADSKPGYFGKAWKQLLNAV
jgi:hypothetical protein